MNGIHPTPVWLERKEVTLMTHKEFFTRGLSGIFAAVIAVGLTWLVALAVSPDIYAKGLGADEVSKITLGTALFVTVLYGSVGVLAGWLLFWRNKPVTWWYALSAFALLAMAIESIVMTETTYAIIWLNIFHVLAAFGIVPSVAISLLDRNKAYPALKGQMARPLASYGSRDSREVYQ